MGLMWVMGTLEQDSFLFVFPSHRYPWQSWDLLKMAERLPAQGKWAVNSCLCFALALLVVESQNLFAYNNLNCCKSNYFSVQKSRGILAIYFLIYALSIETAHSCMMYISQLYSKSPNKTRNMNPTQLLQ